MKAVKRYINGGVQWIVSYPNTYGASVVKHVYSYGGDEGLWELAVIKWVDTDKWKIVYDTPITGDVIGYLTEKEVAKLLDKIERLK